MLKSKVLLSEPLGLPGIRFSTGKEIFLSTGNTLGVAMVRPTADNIFMAVMGS